MNFSDMGESLNAPKLSGQEIGKYGKYSPEEVARIVEASLMNDPENSVVFSSFINELRLNEQFLIQLMKSVQPQSISFFESITGICETRIKEAAEEQQIKDAEAEKEHPES